MKRRPDHWNMCHVMPNLFRHIRTGIQTTAILVLAMVAILLVSLTLPVAAWRTGELPTESIPLQPAEPFAASPVRVWIDTDAACGLSERTDPDDCFAILLLARQNTIEIIGVSTVFGNAPLGKTDRTTRDLIDLLETNGLQTTPVYRGTPQPLTQADTTAPVRPQEAHEAMRQALERGPLVIVALGPLTNVALALRDRPDLQANVTQLVAVMGRRNGHVFHPVEGGTAHSFLGHGPIFRDFNMAKDEWATAVVVAMRLPLTLVPYEASRNVLLDGLTLNRMERLGGPAAWVAQRAQPWLTYWRKEIDLVGFYPFDLLAAAYVAHPSLLHCTRMPIAIKDDSWLFGWLGYRGLFVQIEKEVEPPPLASGTALFCPEISNRLESWLVDQLTSGRSSSPHTNVTAQEVNDDHRIESYDRTRA